MKRHSSFQDIRCSYFYLYREIRKRYSIKSRKIHLEESLEKLKTACRQNQKINRSRRAFELASTINWEIQGCESDLEHSARVIEWIRIRIKNRAYQLG